jgi:uncharacterized membrane protein YdjX (TVP38/TMEM64 family)
MSNRNKLKITLGISLLVIFISIYTSGIYKILNLDYFLKHKTIILNLYQHNPLLVILSFMAIYISSTGLSIPGAVILTLTSGAIFGPITGTIIVSISATIGASLAFLCARFLFQETLEKKYKNKLAIFNKGIKENGFNYLLFIRLVPLFPFFLINLIMGLTKIPLKIFFAASLIGMVPITFIFCNAGSQLSNISSIKELYSQNILIAFSLLGLMSLTPVIYKKARKHL